MMSPGIWAPYLIALYPLFFLWSWNAAEVDPAEALLPTIVLLAATGLLLIAVRRIIPNRDAAAIAVSGFWGLLFAFGPLHHYFTPLDWRLLLTGMFLLGGGLFWLASRVRSPLGNLTQILGVCAVVLILVASYEIVRAIPKRSAIYRPLDPPSLSLTKPQSDLPDIYYIIPDGYGRADILLDRYGFDNSPFLDALNDRGFRVLDRSRTNYIITWLSLASSLNMEHVADLGSIEPVLGEWRLIRNSTLEKALKTLGYTTIGVESGRLKEAFGGFDQLVSPEPSLSTFQTMLLNMTPLKIFDPFIRYQYRRHGENVLSALEHLGDPPGERPIFVMAHLLAPHPPFIFDRNGKPVHPDWPISFLDGSHYHELGGTREEYIEGYTEYCRFLNDQLIEVIDRILDRPGPRPIIILQGDHGPAAGLDWGGVEQSDLPERGAILNAWLAPELLLSALPDTLTPVNSFRYLLNDLANANLAYRPDSSYYSSWDLGVHNLIEIRDINQDTSPRH